MLRITALAGLVALGSAKTYVFNAEKVRLLLPPCQRGDLHLCCAPPTISIFFLC